jgi:hypothetical protein
VLVEGGIEPFNIGRIDHTFALGGSNDLFDHGLLTLNDHPLDIQDASLFGFDDLSDRDIGPFHQGYAPSLTFGARDARSKRASRKQTDRYSVRRPRSITDSKAQCYEPVQPSVSMFVSQIGSFCVLAFISSAWTYPTFS